MKPLSKTAKKTLKALMEEDQTGAPMAMLAVDVEHTKLGVPSRWERLEFILKKVRKLYQDV